MNKNNQHEIEEKIGELTPLIQKYAGKYQQPGIGIEDLVQEGTIGVWEAWQRFDENKGAQFSTYAVYWIKKRMLALLEREIGRPESALEQPDIIEDSEEPEPHPSRRAIQADVNLLSDLPPLEREIILYSYRDNLPLNAIAEMLGISRERVRQLRAKAQRRIKLRLNKEALSWEEIFKME